MGDVLRVCLRLVPPAHDPERDARIPLFHEGGNYGVQGPLSGGERIGRGGLEREERTAVVQYEAGAVGDDARSKIRVIALNQRDHVAIAIDGAEIDGAATRLQRARADAAVR